MRVTASCESARAGQRSGKSIRGVGPGVGQEERGLDQFNLQYLRGVVMQEDLL